MWRMLSILFLFGLLPATALAQPVPVPFGPPSIRWESRPSMVVVGPGFSVVEDYPEEVFYSGSWYWTQQDGYWYRSRDHRGHWRAVSRERVPSRFYSHQAGQYRHYRSTATPARSRVRSDGRSGTHYQRGKHPGKSGKASDSRRGGRRSNRAGSSRR